MKDRNIILLIVTIIVVLVLIPVIVIVLIFNLIKSAANNNNSANTTSLECNIIGTIAVSSREEKEVADFTIKSIFNALENKDANAIKSLFSDYAKTNSVNLDGKIIELINFYPGAEGGYEGAAASSESNDYGTKTHSLELIIDVENQVPSYRMIVSIYMREDYDPSKIGVHLIEVYYPDQVSKGFKHKNSNSIPGVYVLE